MATTMATDSLPINPPPAVERFLALSDLVSRALLVLSVVGVLAITGIMAFEVIARNLFNAPTHWSVEIVTYLVVATAFLPLAQVHRDGAHIRVELLDTIVSKPVQTALWRYGRWTMLFIVAMMTWQYSAYVTKDFLAGSRDWGLLRTPLWMPEAPVLIGLAGLLLSVLAEIFRVERCDSGRIFAGTMLIVILAGLLLFSFGIAPVFVLNREIDLGTLVVLFGTAGLAVLLSGWRQGLVWLVGTAVFAGLAYLLSAVSFVAVGGFIAGGILVYLLVGMPVSIAIGAIAFFGLYFLLPVPQLSLLADRPWRALNSYTYSAIPMFILMGSILVRSGITASFFGAIARLLFRVPGGLAHASLASSALFAAVSGSSIATAATIGQVAGPEMLKRNYSSRLALGAIAGGGTLGILIPPSIPMIVYGATVGAPVTVLFAAGIVPGLVVVISMMAVVMVWSLMDRSLARSPGESAPPPDQGHSFASILPFILLIVCVLGSIYTGFVTPTEAGALGVCASLVLTGLYGRLSFGLVGSAATEAAKLSAGILFIVVATSILTWVMDYAQIPQSIVGLVESLALPTFVLLVLIALFYVFLGMFIDPISMMLMTVSITLPLVQIAGYDEIWFGIALMLMIEVGLITPPVGMILFVLRGLFPETPLREIVYGALPFVIVILLNIALFAIFPGIITALPEFLAR